MHACRRCPPLIPALVACLLALPGCGLGGQALEPGFGTRGMYPGQFVRPRGLAADRAGHPDPELFVVDFSGRIQVFDLTGRFRRLWQTPTIANGRPVALAVGPDQKIAVADSHYKRVLLYNRQGELLRGLDGSTPEKPSNWGYISGVAWGTDGSLFVAEFDRDARIHHLSPTGELLHSFGKQGTEPGAFARPRGLAVLPTGEIVVADSCNHRLQVFTAEGKLVRVIGRQGTGVGELFYPYGVTSDAGGNIYVVEFTNHRVQKFSPMGEPRGIWGRPGRGPGELHSPWGITMDAKGTIWIADTENHRLQRLRP